MTYSPWGMVPSGVRGEAALVVDRRVVGRGRAGPRVADGDVARAVHGGAGHGAVDVRLAAHDALLEEGPGAGGLAQLEPAQRGVVGAVHVLDESPDEGLVVPKLRYCSGKWMGSRMGSIFCVVPGWGMQFQVVPMPHRVMS